MPKPGRGKGGPSRNDCRDFETVQGEKLAARRDELRAQLKVYEANHVDKVAGSVQVKRQNAAKREAKAKQRELESCIIRLEGVGNGVLASIEDVVVRGQYLLTLYPELRDFWLAFRRRDKATTTFAPPIAFAAVPRHWETFGLAHAAAITHDIRALRNEIVPSRTPSRPNTADVSAPGTPPLSKQNWFDQDPGQLNTPLHLACVYCEPGDPGYISYRKTAKFLIESMPSEALLLRNREGQTALVLAASCGATEVVKMLCEHEVPVEANAVFLALSRGHINTAAWLVEYTSTNHESNAQVLHDILSNVLHVIVEAAAREEMSLEAYGIAMDKMIGLGANVNTVNQFGQTPLHVAAKEQNVIEISVDLLRRGAAPYSQDYEGRIPLDYISRLDKNLLRDMFSYYANAPQSILT
mmetsp:Transcript_12685/g.23553  ORF Transcript_12685/g.23553 Transcript_12685/m.23553 type:complete len:411 (+) Transcript_12685:2379-3611(+)